MTIVEMTMPGETCTMKLGLLRRVVGGTRAKTPR
jgi:hypothetical protein